MEEVVSEQRCAYQMTVTGMLNVDSDHSQGHRSQCDVTVTEGSRRNRGQIVAEKGRREKDRAGRWEVASWAFILASISFFMMPAMAVSLCGPGTTPQVRVVCCVPFPQITVPVPTSSHLTSNRNLRSAFPAMSSRRGCTHDKDCAMSWPWNSASELAQKLDHVVHF